MVEGGSLGWPDSLIRLGGSSVVPVDGGCEVSSSDGG